LFHAAEIKLRRCGPGEKIACRFPEDAADGFSNSFVNLAAVADVMEIDSSKLHIEFVKHAVITDAEFEFRPALQSLVREVLQSRPHFINFVLHGFADAGRQVVKRF